MKTDNQYQPKTGARCSCRPGIQRDNCPSCEGTGQVIDFAAIRARKAAPEPERLTIPQFCERECITIRRCERTDSNPNMDESRNMDHWKVQLQIRSPKDRKGRMMSLVFSMGYGHGGKQPEVEEVLNALTSDFIDDCTSFEEWCGDVGYDPDSRKAERTFKACQKETEKLRRFLGDDRLQELVFKVERL